MGELAEEHDVKCFGSSQDPATAERLAVLHPITDEVTGRMGGDTGQWTTLRTATCADGGDRNSAHR